MTSDEDVSQFDTKFTQMTPLDSPDDSMLSESANRVFLGFTYVAPSVLEAMAKPAGRSYALGRSYQNRCVYVRAFQRESHLGKKAEMSKTSPQ